MSICTKHQEINIKYFPLVLFLCLKPVKQRPTAYRKRLFRLFTHTGKNNPAGQP